MKQQDAFFDRLYAQITHDRMLTSILTVYFTINLLLILLTGVAVWPVIFMFKGGDTAVGGFCETVFRANLPLLAVYFVISGLFMFFERRFRFLRTELINIGVGGLVNLIVLMTQRFMLPEAEASNFMLTMLWFIISFMLAWILTLLPSMLICGLAKLIHTVFFKVREWRS